MPGNTISATKTWRQSKPRSARLALNQLVPIADLCYQARRNDHLPHWLNKWYVNDISLTVQVTPPGVRYKGEQSFIDKVLLPRMKELINLDERTSSKHMS